MVNSVKTAVAVLAWGIAVSGAPSAKAADPRAEDAVVLFVDACLTDVLKLRPKVTDPSVLLTEKMGDNFYPTSMELARVDPILGVLMDRKRGGPVWQFTFKRSRAKAWTFRSKGDVCNVLVSNSDEAEIQAAFSQAIEGAAIEAKAVLTAQPDLQSRRRGVTERFWDLRSASATVVMSLRTSQHVGAQHLMSSVSVR